MIDPRTWTDEELADAEQAILTEITARQARTTIPAQISDLTARFIGAGGDPADLHIVITGSQS